MASDSARERADVVVVGLGAMGSAAARTLAARGVRVLALERFRVGHARGSSHGPTRIFRLSYPDAAYVEMAQRSLGLWRELEAEAGEELLVTTGGLDVGPLAEACARALADRGADHEWLSPEACATRFPGIHATERALFQPDAGISRAANTVAAQVRLARAAGADVREDVAVRSVRADGERAVVVTDAGTIAADVAVVTPGAWAAHLVPEANVRAALQTVSYFRPTDDGLRWPTLIEWTEEGFAWYAVPDGGVAPGVKVAEHRPGRPVDPADGPFDPDPEAIELAEHHVREHFPGLQADAVDAETCLYEMTPDEHFVLDRRGPIVVGTGGSGHGFKFTPLFGELLADLAQGIEPALPLERFSLSRF